MQEPENRIEVARIPLRSVVSPLDNAGEWLREWEIFNSATWDTPLLSAPMLGPALRNFGDGHERLATVYRGNRVVAMALLHMTSLFACTTFQPSQLPLSTLLVAPDESFAAVAASLIKAMPLQVLVLSFPHLDSRFLPRPIDAFAADFHAHMITGAIEFTEDRDGYFSSRSSSLRQNFGNRTRRATAKFGQVRLDVLDQAEHVEEFIALYAATESSGWKGRTGTAVREDGNQGDFYREMLVRAASLGQARMFVLRFGRIPVAQQLALEHGGVLYLLKTTYCEQYRQYAPGVLQRMHVLRWASSRAIHRIELYGRLSEWQRPFVTSTRELYHATYFRNRAVRRLRDVVQHRRRARIADFPEESQPIEAKPVVSDDRLTSPFATAEWYELLERTCFVSARGKIIRISARSRLDAEVSLPLWYRPSRWGNGALSGLSNFYTPLLAPTGSSDDQEEIALEIVRFLRETRGWSTLSLQPIADDAPWVRVLTRELQRVGIAFDRYFCFGNWFADVRGIDSSSFEAKLPSQLRHTLMRAGKRVNRTGDFRIEIEAGKLDDYVLQRCIDDFISVYGRSWKRAEPFTRFIPNLFALASRKGWLRFGCVHQGGRAIASQLWLTHGGVASIYKLAYDAESARYSPGSLLTQALVRYAIDVDHVNEIDYLVGDDTYKQDWMTARRVRSGLIIFNRASAKGLARAAIHYAGRQQSRWFRRTERSGDGLHTTS